MSHTLASAPSLDTAKAGRTNTLLAMMASRPAAPPGTLPFLQIGLQMTLDKIALFYVNEAYSTQNKRVMGRQSAGAGFLKALAASDLREIYSYAAAADSAVAFRKEWLALGGAEIPIHSIPFMRPDRLAEAGLLYRPDPMLSSEAWRRLERASPRAYSLCGVTHTTATHAIMTSLSTMLMAPYEEWDAVVCTSRAVRDSVRTVVENSADFLRERLGATRFSLPQMPVIPLGVHCDDFTIRPAERAAARLALGIAPDQTVVLFVGRLSFQTKAHPLPMYLGLEAASADRKVTLIQAGWFDSDATEAAFKAEAASICPSVRSLFVDGRDGVVRRQAWAAADIFTSLSDNIQETFGLTPIEAMAAGLAVVVTDWDGYRDTVRHGVDGFLVPTLSLPPGNARDLADRYDLGLLKYDTYCGITSQFTAVDVAVATQSYRSLINDAGLRQRMGQAARAHALAQFDWKVVIQSYLALWTELAERRRASPSLQPVLSRRRRPDRPDPFELFESYPSAAVGQETRFRRMDVSVESALARAKLASISFAAPFLPPPRLIERLYDATSETQWIGRADISAAFTEVSKIGLDRALVWMCKAGILTFAQPGPAAATVPSAAAKNTPVPAQQPKGARHPTPARRR